MAFICSGLSATQPFWSDLPSMRHIEKADSLKGYDITKYTIHLKVDEASRYIEGKVIAEAIAEANLSSIQYRLEGGSLAVSEVLVDGVSAPFTHDEGIINIPLNISSGAQFSTSVSYSGVPGNSPAPYNIGLLFTQTGFYTLSNPDAGRFWWPSYDHPWDKALVDWHITVREDWLAAANGLRTGITDNNDGTRTHHWVCSSPVATYVIGFSAGPYVEFDQQAGDIPIQNFVLSGQLANATIDFANTPVMIDYFSQLFGPYPFEKYGHAVVNMSTYAAMEHQTMTTFGSRYLTGDQKHESIVAHELAHQWYGNFITPITMREVWLKESFATYSEFLWVHKKSGWEEALNYLKRSIQQYYISWENANGPHTIFNPEYNKMFAPPTYQKSASVLHMLRLKMGNDAFFDFIRALLTTFPNGNLNTAEFVSLAQQHCGQNLIQFFQQWIYSPGIPDAEFCVFHNGADQAKIYAHSISLTDTDFWLEIPIKLNTTAVVDSIVITAGTGWTENYFGISSSDDLAGLKIDPSHWVLTRSLFTHEPSLISCLAYSGAVSLNWNSYEHIPLRGYQVYRRQLPGGDWQCITPEPVTGLEFTDTSVTNDFTYEYYIAAMDLEGYISVPSNSMTAEPISFPFDLKFLVVDETRDGDGGVFSPADAQVDEYYANALEGFEYDEWDVDVQGAPPVSFMARYPLIFWHSDDFYDILLMDLQEVIGSYILSGGKIILSGWKHPSVFSEGFTSRFLPGINPRLQSPAVFKAAHSDIYPSLYPDPAKLAAPWNGMLPLTYTFENASEALYKAEIHEEGTGHNEPATIHIQANGELVLLGFPLYFMMPDGAKGFLQQIIPTLYPEIIDPQEPEKPALQLYPNPWRRTAELKIQLKNATANMLEIYNIRGQKVLACTDANPHINGNDTILTLPAQKCKALGKGCYIIKIRTAGKSLVRKVMLM